MADFKRQHYVPKFYLKGFSSNGSQKQINILLLKNDLVLKDAQLSKQCAKDYFYSKNTEVEKILGFVENSASSVFTKLASGSELSEFDFTVLRTFALLQYIRTDGARKRLRYGITEMLKPDGEFSDELITEEQTYASLSNFSEMMNVTKDLEVKVLKNTSKTPFITSDDPAVLTNKFLAQKFDKFGGNGLGSGGVILTLPLSPDYVLFLFDPNIYTFGKSSLEIGELTDSREVVKLNGLQVINSMKCIYFNDWNYRNCLVKEVHRQKVARVESRVVVNHAVLDKSGASDTHKSFKVVTEDELQKILNASEDEVHTMVHSYTKPLIPSQWPRVFKYKLKPKFIDTKSGAGLRRPTGFYE